MKIKLIVPEGAPINNYSSLEIIDELNNEFDEFLNSTDFKIKVKKKIEKTPKDAGGLPEIALWVYENFQEFWQDEEFRNLIYLLIKELAFKASNIFGRKDKRETLPRIEITINKKKLNLPNTQAKIDEFIDDLNL